MTSEYAIPAIDVTAAPAAESLMDQDAFAAFYERTARPLWAYLARASGDRALADDLLQESYLRLLRAAPWRDGEVVCRRYLFRIATNLLRDRWRQRPARIAPLDELSESALPIQRNREAERVESQALLGPAFSRMRPQERQMLWLAYAEEATHNEIAQIMGLRPASIRLLLFRARRKLARLLRQRIHTTVKTP